MQYKVQKQLNNCWSTNSIWVWYWSVTIPTALMNCCYSIRKGRLSLLPCRLLKIVSVMLIIELKQTKTKAVVGRRTDPKKLSLLRKVIFVGFNFSEILLAERNCLQKDVAYRKILLQSEIPCKKMLLAQINCLKRAIACSEKLLEERNYLQRESSCR